MCWNDLELCHGIYGKNGELGTSGNKTSFSPCVTPLVSHSISAVRFLALPADCLDR